jgi:hypothetical protein
MACSYVGGGGNRSGEPNCTPTSLTTTWRALDAAMTYMGFRQTGVPNAGTGTMLPVWRPL